MKKAVYILLLILLLGCGKPAYIDPPLKPYVDRFNQAAHSHKVYIDTTEISVIFDTNGFLAKHGLNGLCFDSKVTINRQFWNIGKEPVKTALIFHELGHCALGRSHDTAVRSDGFPLSIMFPNLPPAAQLVSHWKAYVDELFDYAR